MKKIKLRILITAIFTTTWIGLANYDFPYEYTDSSSVWSEYQTEIWKIMKEDNVWQDNSLLNRLLSLFKLSNQWRYDSWTSKAIYYAKMIVNLMLSFVSFIALAMVIYAFYMIFFLKDESGITKAKQVLKWVAIAIIIMWLSWFIVSMIFWVQSNSANSESSNSTGSINNLSNLSTQTVNMNP